MRRPTAGSWDRLRSRHGHDVWQTGRRWCRVCRVTRSPTRTKEVRWRHQRSNCNAKVSRAWPSELGGDAAGVSGGDVVLVVFLAGALPFMPGALLPVESTWVGVPYR